MRFCVRASRDFKWLQDRIGSHFYFSPAARAIEVVNEATGQIMGMTAYDAWTETSAQMSIALDSPIAWRALAGPAFKYPFQEADRWLLLAMVASDNQKSLRMTSHVGFRQTHRIKDAVRKGVDYVLFEMRRNDCRWLR